MSLLIRIAVNGWLRMHNHLINKAIKILDFIALSGRVGRFSIRT